VALASGATRARRAGRARQPAPATLSRSWVDRFGTAVAVREGGVGGRAVLLVAPLELAGTALEAVLAVPAFRGRLVLAVPEAVRAAPLDELLRSVEPHSVVALEDGLDGIAGRGPACPGEGGRHVSSTGIEYLDDEEYPAWEGWPELPASPEAACRAASAAAARGLRAVACGPGSLVRALELTLVR